MRWGLAQVLEGKVHGAGRRGGPPRGAAAGLHNLLVLRGYEPEEGLPAD